MVTFSPGSERPDRRLDSGGRVVTVAFWALALVLGGLRAWSTRYAMDPDSISYLDMGDAYLRHDWRMAINGDWNPLYAWVLTLGKLVFRPPAHFEFPYLHLVNFALYAGGLACFHFFLLQLLRSNRTLDDSPCWRGTISIPSAALLALGYSLYIWSSLDLIEFKEGADLLLAAFLYLAFGLLLRTQAQPTGWKPFVLLGLVLGLGYLTKAVAFLLALVFLGTAWLFAENRRRALPRVLVAWLAFCAIGGPFIAVLSRSKGRWTYGDTGKVAYTIFVTMDSRDRWVPPYFHWQGDLPDAGVPRHPTRRIFRSPDVYEFGSPFQATYGAWYDPSYWYEGVTAHVNLRTQLRVLLGSARDCLRLFVLGQPALLTGLFILLWMSWRPGFRPRDTAINPVLLLPAIVPFGLYGLIHMEFRYVAPTAVVIWLALMTGVRVPDAPNAKRWVAGTVSGVVLTWFLATALWGADDDVEKLRTHRRGAGDAVVQVASKLEELGLRPGDKVAFIGDTFRAYWARLARVRIVAEITPPDATAYWHADDALQSRVMNALAAAGVRAVITDSLPADASSVGWRKVQGLPADRSYYVRFLGP